MSRVDHQLRSLRRRTIDEIQQAAAVLAVAHQAVARGDIPLARSAVQQARRLLRQGAGPTLMVIDFLR